MEHYPRKYYILGMIGLCGALLVGVGEYLLHWADYSRVNELTFAFFAQVSVSRLEHGHSEYFVVGEGFTCDQSDILILDLDTRTSVDALYIRKSNGDVDTLLNPAVDALWKIKPESL